MQFFPERLIIPQQLEVVLFLHFALFHRCGLQILHPRVQALFFLHQAREALLQDRVLLPQVLIRRPLIRQILSQVMVLLLEALDLLCLRIYRLCILFVFFDQQFQSGAAREHFVHAVLRRL